MAPMGKTPQERQAAAQAGRETLHGGLESFHTREAVKYAAKADELEAAGKSRAAARARKVAERNQRKAAEHESARSGQ